MITKFFNLFAVGFISLCYLQANENTSKQNELAIKHRALEIMTESREDWVVSQKAMLDTFYDSNINLAPKTKPESARFSGLITTGKYDLLAHHLYSNFSLTSGANGEFKYYLDEPKMNRGNVALYTKAMHNTVHKLQAGGTAKVFLNWQPYTIDQSNILLSQNFSYVGLSLSPILHYAINKDWNASLVLLIDRKFYKNTRKQGEYPSDDLILQGDIKLYRNWANYKGTLSVGYTHDKFFKQPAFDALSILSVTPEGRPLHLKKTKNWFAKVECDAPHLYLPTVFELEGGITRDDFQGYENYRYIQPGFHTNFPVPEKQTLAWYLSYQRRDYQKRIAFSNPSEPKVHYNIVQTALQYDYEIHPDFSIYEMASFEQRLTNETVGQSDRSYRKFIFGVGVNYAF